jgi:hypothetical protein
MKCIKYNLFEMVIAVFPRSKLYTHKPLTCTDLKDVSTGSMK